jgi:hypothetical protein
MAMTIKDLRMALGGLPDSMQIVVSKDAEGNSFSPLEDIAIGIYTADSTWSGDFTSWADDAGEEEIPEGECNTVCFWPVN